MDTFENNEIPVQPEQPQNAPETVTPPQAEPQQSTYSGAGAGRKESPYANSPYVTNPQCRTEYHYQPQTQPPQKPKKEKKASAPGGVWRKLLALLLVCALVAGGCLATASWANWYWSNRLADQALEFDEKLAALEDKLNQQISAAPGSSGAARPVTGDAMTPAQLYSESVDSVVAISSTVQSQGFYGTTEGAASGSGFIYSADGYVVTNYHVVEGASKVDVILHDGTEYPAEVVGHDASNDIAVLKVEAEGLQPAAIGSSDALNIGDMVVAIGNPLGELASTQTVGYVSGINRDVTTDNTIISMIQTDAAINPGNSGGPLFNMYGQVIGITTAKYSGTTGSGASIEGIGFAIPIDDVYDMISDLIDYGYVTGAYLGITVQNTDAESASMFGLPTGAYVVTVVDDSCADRAGLQPKDIIIDLGGNKVTSVTDLTRALRNFKAGDETTLTVIRSGKEVILNVTLDEKPQQTTTAPQESTEMPDSGDFDEWYDYFRRYFGG